MKHRFLQIAGFLLAMAGCGTSVGNGVMRLELTDAPGEYESVNVELGAVQAHYLGDSEDKGQGRWITIVADGGAHDLLKLQNDVTAVLGEQQLPPGRYTELRMIIDAADVVVDGQTHKLDIPSGDETGLKFPYLFSIEAEKDYVMVLDFDAAASIKTTGGGEYKLEPVITVKRFEALDPAN